MAISGRSQATPPPSARPGPGDQSLKQLSLEQLGNVEVTTVSKQPTQVWQTPAAIYVITQDDIHRSGATSVPEALRLAPGVEVARIDSSKWSIGIRGFGSRLSRSVLVLIDGRTVYTTLFAGTYWEVQNVMLEDVERIEVIRGPGGTIWGPNAVNGVINIITKSAKDTRGLLVSAASGNEEQGLASARYGGTFGNGFNYRLYAMGFDRGPQIHTDGLNFDRWREGQGGFRLDWQNAARDAFSLHGDLYTETAGERVQAGNYDPPFQRTIDGNAQLSGGNLTFQWSRTMGEAKDIKIEAFYDRTNRHEPNLGDMRDTFDVDYVQHYPLWHQKLSWGLGIRASRGREIEVVSGDVFVPGVRTDQLYTAFVQDEIPIVPNRLSLFAGTKLLVTNYAGIEPEPSFRMLWTPTATETVWASFTHAVRTPSDAERDFYLSSFLGNGVAASNSLPTFARFNANPDFQSETLDGDELGYRHLFRSNVYLDVAAFYNNYRHLLSQELTGPFTVATGVPFPDANPPFSYNLISAQFRNGLRGNTKGVEIAPEWQVLPFWRLRGSYSFLHMNLAKELGSGDLGTAPSIQGSSPEHQATVQSYLDLPKSVSFNFEYRFVSALLSQSVPAYSTANVHVSWRLNRNVEFSVVGDNLFQGGHAEFAGDPGPLVLIRRSAYGKVTFTK